MKGNRLFGLSGAAKEELINKFLNRGKPVQGGALPLRVPDRC